MTVNFTSQFLYRVYALGYYHGRALGVSDNAYARADARVAYAQGYDAGAAAAVWGEDEEYGYDMDGDHASALASAGYHDELERDNDEPYEPDYGSAGDSY